MFSEEFNIEVECKQIFATSADFFQKNFKLNTNYRDISIFYTEKICTI